MKDQQTTFETVPCSRCGGGGHYSYCQSYGTVCFKCHGRGVAYTARGEAAKAFFSRLLSKPTVDLQPGDKIYHAGPFTSAKWHVVEEVYKQTAERRGSSWSLDPVTGEPVYSGYIVNTKTMNFGGVQADQLWRVAATAEQKADALAKALAYQETLTKQGKHRKRDIPKAEAA